MKEMEQYFKKEIKSEHEWNGSNYKFDPDSSPEAWEHYKKYYTADHWHLLNKYNFDSLNFFNYQKGYYVNKAKSAANRLNALPKGVTTITKRSNKYRATERLCGEVDFNFNKLKSTEFKRLLKQDKSAELGKHLLKLSECQKMHHSVLNFSLMQVVGNLQGTKSRGINDEWLDRLDSFVAMLSRYYRTNKKERSLSPMMEQATPFNRRALQNFLDNAFLDEYDYCSKTYFIQNRDFIDRLIEQGNQAINASERVVAYMELAFDFWEEKYKGLTQCSAAFEPANYQENNV